MIETHKLFAASCDNTVTPNVPISLECRTRENSLQTVNRRSRFAENSLFAMESQIHGIVCPKMLLLPHQLTHS